MSYITKSSPPESAPDAIYYYISAGEPYLSFLWKKTGIAYVVKFRCNRRAEEVAELVKKGILNIMGLQNNPEYFGVRNIFREPTAKAAILFDCPFIHRDTIRKIKYKR